jgi:hypothetical protein
VDSERPIQEPRWIRPKMFIQIVGLYLLVSKVIVILLAIAVYQTWEKNSLNQAVFLGFDGIYLIPLISIMLVWLMLSIIGSTKLFLLQRNGFWISLAALFMTIVIFPSIFTLYLNIANNFSAELINTNTNYAISSLTIAGDMTMIPLLLVSSKRIKWKS